MDITCAACKQPADDMVEFKPSSNFTTYADLAGGHMLMDRMCHMLMTGNKYRLTSWILEGGKVTAFKRADALDILLREKREPFVIYVTTAYKRQAYMQALSMQHRDPDEFDIFFEDHFVPVDRRDVKRMAGVIFDALKRGWSKMDLTSGPSPARYEDRAFCKLVRAIRDSNRLLWEVVVFVA